jgi:hypothetical protein
MVRCRHRDVAAQVERPTCLAIDSIGDRTPTDSMSLEVSMFQFHPSAVIGLGDEAHFDLARLCRISFELPRWSDVPRKDDTGWRLVGEDTRPLALAAVGSHVVDVPANAWLEDGFGDWDREQIVFAWLDGVELVDEEFKRSLDARVDDDALAYWFDR